MVFPGNFQGYICPSCYHTRASLYLAKSLETMLKAGLDVGADNVHFRNSRMSISPIVGLVEHIGFSGIYGWAYKAGDSDPLRIFACVDNINLQERLADLSRPDVLNARHDATSAHVGFHIPIPSDFCDGQMHKLVLHGPSGRLLALRTSQEEDAKDAWSFEIARFSGFGQIEPSRTSRFVHGWALIEDRLKNVRSGGAHIRVTGKHGVLADLNAIQQREDVATSHNADASCGFVINLEEPRFLNEETLEFLLQPMNIPLLGSPLVIASSAEVRNDVLTGASGAPSVERNIAEIAEEWSKHQRNDDELRLIASQFDFTFYLFNHPELVTNGQDPLIHFHTEGWRTGDRPAPWFDTSHYVRSNPDIAAAGVDPFWHYLVSGVKEGRAPARPRAYLHKILETAVPPKVRAADYVRQEPDRLLTDVELHHIVGDAIVYNKGFILSVSHDCYVLSEGGVQIFLEDEQEKFRDKKIAYFHVSPIHPDLILADLSSEPIVRLVVDGVHRGVCHLGSLALTLGSYQTSDGASRDLVLHCLLGHAPEHIVSGALTAHIRQSFLWLHDFSTVCEGFNLLRNDIAFCEAPPTASNSCHVCIYGSERVKHVSRVQRLVSDLDPRIIAPSKSTARIWVASSLFPNKQVIVKPHCALSDDCEEPRKRASLVKVAFVGRPAAHKGWFVFEEIVRRTAHLGSYDFVHFASHPQTSDVAGIRFVRATTSKSDRDGMRNAIATEGVEIVLMPASWPETFSYVVLEALAGGADIFTVESAGNVADVTRELCRGRVFDNEAALLTAFEAGEVIKYLDIRERASPRHMVHLGTTANIEV